MLRSRSLLVATVLCAGLAGTAPGPAAAASLAARATNGDVLARARCDWPSDSYREYRARLLATWREDAAAAQRAGLALRPDADLARAMLDEAEWRGRRSYRDYACERLLYASDGLAVVAYLWRPAQIAGRQLPLIVFNRGGNGEQQKLRPNTQFGFWRFVQADYVVLATQYRGNDGSEGRESWADGDVRDVLNLFPVAEKLGFVDTKNAFMLGYSRGALVTMLALQRGAPVNAAATVGGLFDLSALARVRPEIEMLAAGALPGMPSNVALKTLSAVEWPDRIGVPLLLLHGGADGVLDAGTQSLALARALHEKKKPYSVVVYEGDTHGLTLSAADRDQRILEWFARHRRPGGEVGSGSEPKPGAATPPAAAETPARSR
jgi:dipeptidyl aminopeptidase/acylaminoacyl peptidase